MRALIFQFNRKHRNDSQPGVASMWCCTFMPRFGLLTLARWLLEAKKHLPITRAGRSFCPFLERLEDRVEPSASILLNGPQVAQAALNADFRSSNLVYAVAIAGAESSYYLDQTNSNANGTTDYGLWQINSIHCPP
jgi:hypothetical protein